MARYFLYKNFKTLFSNQTRSIYSDRFLYIDKFRKEKLKVENSFKQQEIDNLKLKLKSNHVEDLDRTDLVNLFYLSNDKNEFDSTANLFKKYLKYKLQNSLVKTTDEQTACCEFDDLLYLFSKSFYILNLTDIAKNILDDKELEPLHRSSYPSLLSMNMLLIDKQYDQVYTIFEKCFQFYPMDVKNRKKIPNQEIPITHLSLVCESLLLSNNSDSIRQLENLLNKIQTTNSKLNNQSIACCFLMLIKQNKLDMAEKLIETMQSKTDIQCSIYLNLRTILYAKMNDLKSALDTAFQIIKIKMRKKPEMTKGRIFPYTMVQLKNSIEKNLTEEYSKKYEYLEQSCILYKRLCKIDLIEYCTKMKI